MKPYQQYLEDLTKTFDKIEYTIIPRAQNQFTNALATLASMVEIPEGVWTRPLEIEQSYKEMHKGMDGADKREHCSIRMMVIQYILQWYTPSLLKEGKSQKGNGRSSSRDL